MRTFRSVITSCFLVFSIGLCAQETETQQEEVVREAGHTNQNKFRQLYQEFSTPNQYRTGSGAPGPA